jgi:eukaryotic-like serine/threonine-protein kinase
VQQDSAPAVVAGRYQLDRYLAAGGFGAVWAATDLALARPVAVKVLHAGYAGYAEALSRFRAEARLAAGLSHENIARVYDYGEPPAAAAPYLVMELVRGPSLADLLAGGPLDPVRVADILAQAGAGLDAAHRAGLVHRDIKPGNLLVSPDGQVKITDFGIAHAAGSAPLTRTGQLMGTPGYLAPERACGAQATPLSDLYALGMLAWECLAGGPPFTGSAVEVAVAHRDRPLPPLPASVPAPVADLVIELTAKHPAARPETAGYVARRAAMIRDRLTAGSALLAGAPPGPAATLEMPVAPAAAATADLVAPAGLRAGGPLRAGPAAQPARVPPGRAARSRWMPLTAGSLIVAIIGLVLGAVISQLPSRPAQAPTAPAAGKSGPPATSPAGPARAHGHVPAHRARTAGDNSGPGSQ